MSNVVIIGRPALSYAASHLSGFEIRLQAAGHNVLVCVDIDELSTTFEKSGALSTGTFRDVDLFIVDLNYAGNPSVEGIIPAIKRAAGGHFKNTPIVAYAVDHNPSLNQRIAGKPDIAAWPAAREKLEAAGVAEAFLSETLDCRSFFAMLEERRFVLMRPAHNEGRVYFHNPVNGLAVPEGVC